MTKKHDDAYPNLDNSDRVAVHGQQVNEKIKMSRELVAYCQQVNEKIKMIRELVADADQLVVKGQLPIAKRVYIECAEALVKLSE